MDQRLGIRGRGEPMPPSDQVGSELPVVVDLAIEDDPDAAVLVADGLVAAREVDDAEAAHPHAEGTGQVASSAVRAAVDQDVGHPLQDIGVNRPLSLSAERAVDTTHGT